MPTNLLLLPLLGGFWFLHRCHYFRFRAQTLDGNRLLLESALAGVTLGVVARFCTFLLMKTGAGSWAAHVWSDLGPDIPFSGTAITALGLGVLLPLLINLVIRQNRAKRLAIRRHGSNLLKLVNAAPEEGRPLSVTLDNRKVYIGYVSDAPNMKASDSHLTIIPLLSGYRDDKTLELRFTTDYASTVGRSGMDLSAFQVTVPISSIRIASFFDPAAYQYFDIEGDSSAPVGDGLAEVVSGDLAEQAAR